MRILPRFLFLGFFYNLLIFNILAQDIYPKPSPAKFVNDFSQTLNKSEIDSLEAKLKAYSDSTSTQIVVVFISGLGGHNLEAYANTLARTWGIGQKGQDNGILILIVKNDRKIRLELGYGIEDKITDLDANYLIDKYLRPNFRIEQYAKGLDLATEEIFKYLAGQYKNNNPRTSIEIQASVKRFWFINERLGIGLLVAGVFVIPIFYLLSFLIFGTKLLRTPFAYLIGCLPYFIIHGSMLYAFGILTLWHNTVWVILIDIGLGILTGFIYQEMARSESSKTYESGSSSGAYSNSYSDSSSSYSDSSSSYSDSSFGGGDFGGGGASGDW
jgi:uncharacterized protein